MRKDRLRLGAVHALLIEKRELEHLGNLDPISFEAPANVIGVDVHDAKTFQQLSKQDEISLKPKGSNSLWSSWNSTTMILN